MLQSLLVRNLALIEEAEVHFENGLNILSGETGAGKSILIGSITTALGARAARDIIRTGTEGAYVELVFSVENPSILQKLTEQDILLEDGQLILSRKITSTKNICRINGEAVPVAKLREIAALLLDLHGQHDHQILLERKRHLEILDQYGKTALDGSLNQVACLYKEYRTLEKTLESYGEDAESRKREMDFLQFEWDEIQEADLDPQEEDHLLAAFKKQNHMNQIRQGVEKGMQILENADDERVAILDGIGQMLHEFQFIAAADETFAPLYDQLLDLEAVAMDLAGGLRTYHENLHLDEEEMDRMQHRLDLLHKLKNKYGKTLKDVLDYQKKTRDRLEFLQNYEEEKIRLEERYDACRKELMKACEGLSKKRKGIAEEISLKIKEGLTSLNFFQADFQVEVAPAAVPGPQGMDQVRFLLSANPGEPLKPLDQVASGGELSRIMLAIKSVLAKAEGIPTLLFDEIDSGISGRTAQKVAEKLQSISRDHQVICISHLPQIVAMADVHFRIQKERHGEYTVTSIQKLNRSQMIEEIARLLGGTRITAHVLENAEEMKALAEHMKKNPDGAPDGA